jgi:hypothetical protein
MHMHMHMYTCTCYMCMHMTCTCTCYNLHMTTCSMHMFATYTCLQLTTYTCLQLMHVHVHVHVHADMHGNVTPQGVMCMHMLCACACACACRCAWKCHSTGGQAQDTGATSLIRTVIVRCELAALLTVQRAARVFLCVVYHKLGRLAARRPSFFHLAPTPKAIPYRHVARRRSFAVQVCSERGMRLISANQMEIETARPPDFSTYEL